MLVLVSSRILHQKNTVLRNKLVNYSRTVSAVFEANDYVGEQTNYYDLILKC